MSGVLCINGDAEGIYRHSHISQHIHCTLKQCFYLFFENFIQHILIEFIPFAQLLPELSTCLNTQFYICFLKSKQQEIYLVYLSIYYFC